MGLDITAYAKVTLVRAIEVKDYNKDEEAQALVDSGDHRYFCQDSDDRPQSEGMPAGIYATSGTSFGFCAGSYGGYNHWRNQLAEMMLGAPARALRNADGADAGRPFVELICFSDCEGFIGPKTCAKLSADFANNQDKANKGDEYFRAKYADWRKAFAIASEGGAVDFH